MTTLDELEKLLAEWKQACARIDDPLQKDVIKLKALELALGIESALPGLIESARKVERLEAALKPFADFEEAIRQSYQTHRDTDSFYIYNMTAILMGDFRRARAALAA
jgi:hypothetical protein